MFWVLTGPPMLSCSAKNSPVRVLMVLLRLEGWALSKRTLESETKISEFFIWLSSETANENDCYDDHDHQNHLLSIVRQVAHLVPGVYLPDQSVSIHRRPDFSYIGEIHWYFIFVNQSDGFLHPSSLFHIFSDQSFSFFSSSIKTSIRCKKTVCFHPSSDVLLLWYLKLFPL